MAYTIKEIKEKVATDDRWAIRAMLAIYKRQTATEKAMQETRDRNGVGFNGVDGQIMSSIAEFYLKHNFVSRKQMVIIKKKMGKYAGQLAKIANREIA